MSFLFRHRDPGSRHVYRYGPLRITCVDRDVPIDVRVNAHLMYKVVLSWEDKARCATPFDMSRTILRLCTSAFFHAVHARRPRYVQLLDEHRHAARHRAQPVADRLERWANRRTNRRCAHAGRPWKPP